MAFKYSAKPLPPSNSVTEAITQLISSIFAGRMWRIATAAFLLRKIRLYERKKFPTSSPEIISFWDSYFFTDIITLQFLDWIYWYRKNVSDSGAVGDLIDGKRSSVLENQILCLS